MKRDVHPRRGRVAAARRQRLAAGRVRRRRRRRRPTRRRARVDGRARSGEALRRHEALRRPSEEQHVWQVREAGLGATAFIPGKPRHLGGLGGLGRPARALGDYLRDLRKLLERYGYDGALYGHFGQGCVHARIELRPDDDARASRSSGASSTTRPTSSCRYGGSLSGEHGDGQSRAELLPKMFGDELVEAFREFKAIWDPDWKMNPGKVVDPYPHRRRTCGSAPTTRRRSRRDALRLSRTTTAASRTRRCAASASASAAARRRRRCARATWCTREEKHTTRGRAHLLFEMLEGEPLERRLAERRGQRGARPLPRRARAARATARCNVDMATYKAEFLSHYYERRLRPRHAYAFGLIDGWARLASHAPGARERVTQTPGRSRRREGRRRDARRSASCPRSRRATLQRLVPAPAAAAQSGGAQVMLWPDTFNNHFHPEVGVGRRRGRSRPPASTSSFPRGHSAAAGRSTTTASSTWPRRYLRRRSSTRSATEIRAGTPVVGLEPSCVAVFRDELAEAVAARRGRQAPRQAGLPPRRVPRGARG